MIIEGKAWTFGNNIDTDVILPGKYLVVMDPRELGKHAMEGLDPSFPQKVSTGDIIIAGRYFGCGSSREQAPVALKSAGIAAVVAESFARIQEASSLRIGVLAGNQIAEDLYSSMGFALLYTELEKDLNVA